TRGLDTSAEIIMRRFVAMGAVWLLLSPVAAHSQQPMGLVSSDRPRLVAQLGRPGWSVALSADCKWLVCGGGIWEFATGREIRGDIGHPEGVRCQALSTDGKWLVTGGWDKTARMWEL